MESVKDLAYQVTDHLIKIVCYTDNENRNDWKGEVVGWLNTLSRRVKTNNGRLKKKDIFFIFVG